MIVYDSKFSNVITPNAFGGCVRLRWINEKLLLYNITFEDNISFYGTGFYIFYFNDAHIYNITYKNCSSSHGTAINARNYAKLTVENSTFIDQENFDYGSVIIILIYI